MGAILECPLENPKCAELEERMYPNVLKVLICLVVVSVISTPANAQEITVTSKVKSSYLGLNGGVFYDEPVVQPDVYIEWPNGVYADLWASTAFNGDRAFDKEIDLTLGFNGTVSHVDFTVEANYFILIVPDIFNVNLEARKAFSMSGGISVIPFLRIEGYVPVVSDGPRRGLMAVAGVRIPIQIVSLVSSSFKAQIRRDTGCFGGDPAVLAQGSLDFDVRMSEVLHLLVGVMYSDPITSVSTADGRKASVAYSGGFSYSF